MKFYDAKEESDLNRVEAILQKGGIEYTVAPATEAKNSQEICVAEEDVPFAEELLLKATITG
ncbi:hypothetical protein [Geomesophilobacter sediminis]|uniref:DUF2007 domain-containing protein n=1 Tax=Geomesophilobacter sediminis TaxID=2798584 RepID=A0A8J7LY05_9BACT|nr:hypothetical protein [Geomesophilobacter sediminis]MBJ6724036.1 hypothetical protein [Geomesophilobacter sediminis]